MSEALRYESGQVPYRLCNTPTPLPTPAQGLDYDKAFSIGAGEWNSRNSDMSIVRHSGTYGNDSNTKMVSAYYVDGDPCGSAGALGCVQIRSTPLISTSTPYLVAQNMEIKSKPSNRMWTLDSMQFSVSKVYLPAVISHEFGHAAGVGHSPRRDDLMYYKYQRRISVPSSNDITAMKEVYK